MASSGDNDEYKWPNSGQDGPDVEWEHVPIEIPGPISWPPIPEMAEIPTIFPPISPETEDQPPEDTKEEEAKLPSVEDMKLEGEDTKEDTKDESQEDKPKIQVSTLERYYPSPQEVKETYPDNLDELFDKHGDELIIQDDENGKPVHIFFLFGEYEDKKHYKCIRKGCNSFLVLEEIPKPPPSPAPTPGPGATRKTPKEDPQDQQKGRTPKGKEEKEEAEEDPKEGGSKEDHKEKEDVKEEEKGAKKKKRKPKKKKSNKNKKEEADEGFADEDPKEGCSKEDQKVMKVMKVQSFISKGIQKLYK